MNNEPIILSCSGSYGDDEAVLKWNKHLNEVMLLILHLDDENNNNDYIIIIIMIIIIKVVNKSQQ